MAIDVLPVVEELALAGSAGFRASFIADRLQASDEEIRLALIQLVDGGDLNLRFALLCPDNGRTIHVYSADQQLPIGETVSNLKCESSEPFEVEKAHIWVTFEPSLRLVQRVNREATSCAKKKALQPAPGSGDDSDTLLVYEGEELIRQDQAGLHLYGCRDFSIDASQTAATEGGTAAGGAAQAVSGAGVAARDQGTAAGSGSTISLSASLRRSKLSIAFGSLAIFIALAATALLITGRTDAGIAGYVLALLGVIIAAIPLFKSGG
jgi:hypothetical protein